MKTRLMLIVGGVVLVAAIAAGTGTFAIAAGTTEMIGLGGTETTEADTLPNLLIIVGPEGQTSYDLVVDGELRKSDERGVTIDPEDTIDGSRATGIVAGNGADAYRYSGDITAFSLDGEATVYVNGEEVDPTELGRSTTTTVATTPTATETDTPTDTPTETRTPTTTATEPRTTETDGLSGSVEPADEYERGPRNYVRVEDCDTVVIHRGDAYPAKSVGIGVGGEHDWIDLEEYEPIRYTAPDGQTIDSVYLYPFSSDEYEAGYEPMAVFSPCSD